MWQVLKVNLTAYCNFFQFFNGEKLHQVEMNIIAENFNAVSQVINNNKSLDPLRAKKNIH